MLVHAETVRRPLKPQGIRKRLNAGSGLPTARKIEGRALQGLELCREFYRQCVSPAITERFGKRACRVAAGLAGQGSDCLGYDDDISRDHDFGPGCCLWMTDEDFTAFGSELQELYDTLPGEFMGFSRNVTAQASGRVGVIPISRFYVQFTGCPDVPPNEAAWFRIPEHHLASATSGEVFYDDLGEFSRIRKALLPCYPEDVRLKKLAARVFVMAQAGQYNYGRIIKRGDGPAAMLALDELVRAALSAVHLLNKRYMPYYKWAFRSARALPRLAEVVRELESLYTALDAERQNIIESICLHVRDALQKDGLSSISESFLVPQAEEIMKRLKSDYLKKLGVSVG